MSGVCFLVAGDLLPVVDATLLNEHGDPVDLSLASSVGVHVRATGAATPFIVGASCAFSAATPGAPSCGHVTYAWAASAVPTQAGLYEVQFRAWFPASKSLTVPNPGFQALMVGPRL